MRRLTLGVVVLLVTLAVGAESALGQIATRSFFGVRPTPGFNVDPWGSDISDAGVVVGSESSAFGERQVFAFRWDRVNQLRRLPLASGYSESSASAISEDGRVIVGTAKRADGTWVAVEWVDGADCRELEGVPSGFVSAAVQTGRSGRLIAGYVADGDLWRPVRWFVWERGVGIRWPLGSLSEGPHCRITAVHEEFGGIIDGAITSWRGETPFRLWGTELTIIRAPERLCRDQYRVYEVTCSDYFSMAGVVRERGVAVQTWRWTGHDELFHIAPDARGNVLVPRVCSSLSEVLLGETQGPDQPYVAIVRRDEPIMSLRESFIASNTPGIRSVALFDVHAGSAAGTVGGGALFCEGLWGLWVFLASANEPICPDLAGDDGMVTGYDLNRLLLAVGTAYDPCADLNRDGSVDTRDITIMLSNIGRTCR